ncbi:hypothetical protein AB0M32_52200 [Streptomyces sp. NPDC051985]|uniref:hypothetical protein n=1 Tax=Streptomyces sp. NPDC051985 TaxID=3155807 RepID=UPI0034227B5D
MLLMLTGSSGAGKTTLAFAVADRLHGVVVREFDEVGVPDPPIPPHWRNRMTELWVCRALEYQASGMDLLLSGNSPLGEVLAAPSAPLLEGIAVCLIDVADRVRRDRLAVRDKGRWDQDATDAFCGWAAWHRGHARDPRFRPDVVIDGSWPEMAWQRWTGWTAEDPRWSTCLIDTTDQPLTTSVDRVERWVTEQRLAHRSGRLALSRGWTGDVSRPAAYDA